MILVATTLGLLDPVDLVRVDDPDDPHAITASATSDGPEEVRTPIRMASIGAILRELQIFQYYSNT